MNSSFIDIEPFKLKPAFLEKIWGGQVLRTKLNKEIDEFSKIGESWEISGEPSNPSIVRGGNFDGQKLNDLCTMYGPKLLGKADKTTGFPLLYKFIDANDKLSVQVHPDDLQASNYAWGSRGKTECWFIVDAPADTCIIVGLKKAISQDEMLNAIKIGTFRNLLKEEPIKKGDLLFIPAGTIHAIMSNTLIYEVQESSDITLRVYDWDRSDNNGKPRALHIDEAVKVTNTNSYGSFKIKPVILSTQSSYTHFYRVACQYFAIEQLVISKPTEIKLAAKQSFSVLTIIKGSVNLTYLNRSLKLLIGESAIIPAYCTNCSLNVLTQTEVLLSSVPDLLEEVIIPLKNQGVPLNEIIQLGGVVPEKNDLLPLIG